MGMWQECEDCGNENDCSVNGRYAGLCQGCADDYRHLDAEHSNSSDFDYSMDS